MAAAITALLRLTTRACAWCTSVAGRPVKKAAPGELTIAASGSIMAAGPISMWIGVVMEQAADHLRRRLPVLPITAAAIIAASRPIIRAYAWCTNAAVHAARRATRGVQTITGFGWITAAEPISWWNAAT